MNNTKISCPQCGFNFDVEDALSSQVEERLRAEQQKKTAEIDKAYMRWRQRRLNWKSRLLSEQTKSWLLRRK